jgi:hypothetical protein
MKEHAGDKKSFWAFRIMKSALWICAHMTSGFKCSRVRYKHIMYWVQHNGAAKLLTLTPRVWESRERGPSGKFTINPYTHLMHSSPFKNQPKGEEDVVWMLHHVTFARREQQLGPVCCFIIMMLWMRSLFIYLLPSRLCALWESVNGARVD